jgi:putative phosphoesterase
MMMLGRRKLGFLSDAHGNATALEKGIQLLHNMGAETIFHLGDSVGYIPCVETLKVLDARGIVCQKGNHEAYLFEPRDAYLQDDISRLSEVRTLLNEQAMCAVGDWPTERIIQVGNSSLHLVHASPRDTLNEYVYPNSAISELLDYAKADSVIMGHTHRPFIRYFGRKTFVNVGSCGLPRDDARFGAAVLFDPKAEETWRIIRFDIEIETSKALKQFGAAPEVWKMFLTRRQK